MAGAGIEVLVQLGTTGRIDGGQVFVAAATGAASGGLSTAARIGRGLKAAGVGLLSFAEGRAKAGLVGEQTTLLEDAANAGLGLVGFGVGDALSEVTARTA